MTTRTDKVAETATFIKTHFFHTNKIQMPQTAFMTGTGLGDSTSSMDIETSIPYGDIPNFPLSTVESHKGELVFGLLGAKPLMVMQGRFHLYEGYSPREVTFPIRVMQHLGIKNLIISNASGGLNLNFRAGDIMLITDHINLTGCNPLTGPNEDTWGIRFPDMTEVYDKELRTLALKAAQQVRDSSGNPLFLRHGVYAGLQGPSLETPAETRYLKTIGADAVGFSTIMEAIAGVHANMKILGLATITNINNPDAPEKATVEEIINKAKCTAGKINQLLVNLMTLL
ncbi:Purine nucleoside phosphorylase 1 [Desulfamplus magnetovallimortis]|uniref:Purine nucleoside phosphorylase n=1 Tax=Desulfamplus magnetovallimortis TaxID=1246637 RepID=A0A1W1HE53_9BACT|nr:purine-nucleoside phosphorylase [Desulfamplus magnetovallimortis]SLM30655.1 Purine nucleoside phosphorylase 1 [Desulfamplus magnetovallimortis]